MWLRFLPGTWLRRAALIERHKKLLIEERPKQIAAKNNKETVGLISIDFPYTHNANIYWMAVQKEYHRQGIGVE